MLSDHIPLSLRRAPAPGPTGFAVLAGIEASLRGTLVSVWPLVMYQALGEDAGRVSLVYFSAGIASLSWGLMVPWLNRRVPRRWLYTLGASLYVVAGLLAIRGGGLATPVAMVLANCATVTVFICTNAYIMDFIARQELGRVETQKLLYSGLSWAIGPMAGVFLWKWWPALPFLMAILFAATLTATFWYLRLGNGRLITRARAPAPNPLAYLGRFFRQPRLIAGWLFAVVRSSGWWVYVVYLPMFCIEAGLGDRVASVAYSASNALLLLAPFIMRWMRGRGLRRAVRTAFGWGAVCFALAGFGQVWPPAAVLGLMAGSLFLVMLDTYGGLPFLMAVKPAERTEMAAVYSSFRDVSGILTPGVAWVVLLALPVAGVFVASAAGLGVMAALAGRLHPRLGAPRGAESARPVSS